MDQLACDLSRSMDLASALATADGAAMNPMRSAGLIALANVLTSTAWAGMVAASAGWF